MQLIYLHFSPLSQTTCKKILCICLECSSIFIFFKYRPKITSTNVHEYVALKLLWRKVNDSLDSFIVFNPQVVLAQLWGVFGLIIPPLYEVKGKHGLTKVTKGAWHKALKSFSEAGSVVSEAWPQHQEINTSSFVPWVRKPTSSQIQNLRNKVQSANSRQNKAVW